MSRAYSSRLRTRLAAVAVLLLALLAPVAASAAVEAITVSPTEGPAGTKVTVTGTGWQEHGADGTDVPTSIGMTELGRGHPDASGKFSVRITIPADSRPGRVEIDAIIGNGGAASASFTVTGASGGDNKGGQPPRIVRSETFREGPINCRTLSSG